MVQRVLVGNMPAFDLDIFIFSLFYAELAKKVCPRLCDLATVLAGGIVHLGQPLFANSVHHFHFCCTSLLRGGESRHLN